MTGDIVIRHARADEVATLQAVERDAARAYARLPGYGFCVDLPARDDGEHECVRTSGAALVAEVAGATIGFVLALPIDGRAHLLEAAVAHARQGRGYGRRLLCAFEA